MNNFLFLRNYLNLPFSCTSFSLFYYNPCLLQCFPPLPQLLYKPHLIVILPRESCSAADEDGRVWRFRRRFQRRSQHRSAALLHSAGFAECQQLPPSSPFGRFWRSSKWRETWTESFSDAECWKCSRSGIF